MAELILDILRRNISDSSKLKHISAAKGGEWCSPCPVCGGKDRFRTWPNQDGGAVAQQHGVPGTWWCRQCDQGGDVFDLLKFAEGLEFRAACKELRIELEESSRRMRPLRQPKQDQGWVPSQWKIPSEKWRLQATKLANDAHDQLLAHGKALAFLSGRGLPLEAVQRYRLGYLEGEDKTGTCLYRARKAFDLADKMNRDGTKTRTSLWIPRSFTIPLWHPGWQQPDEVHRVRLRRRKGDLKTEKDQKYLLLEGSGQAPMVLLPEGVAPALAPWVVVEAELDAMAVHFACGGKVGVIAVLTNRGKPDVVAHKWLSQAPVILVALDFDPPDRKGNRPGYQGWLWWKETYAAARRWPSSIGKDPGEDYEKGVNLAEWVNLGLPDSLVFQQGGDLGVSEIGPLSLGDGEKQDTPPVAAPKDQKPWVLVDGRKRWAGTLAHTPLSEALLPNGVSYSVEYLRKYYGGRQVEPELLILCPHTKPAWHWLYFKTCEKCPGHPFCLVDFLTSPQMLALCEPEASHV